MSLVADASLPTITVEHAIALMETAAKAPATAQATREERILWQYLLILTDKKSPIWASILFVSP